MTHKFAVAEGILDGAAEEYLEANISSADAVAAYAFSGLGIVLGTADAERVLAACRAWVAGTKGGTLNGSHDYYHTVEEKLTEED